MQAIAKKREDCELQYLLSRSVRNSRAAALRLHRSFALRSSASLHPAQRALGSVMSQVKRFEVKTLASAMFPRNPAQARESSSSPEFDKKKSPAVELNPVD